MHAGVVERTLQGGLVAAQAAVVEHLQLDGVQREGDGVGNLRIAGQLRLIGRLARGGVRVIGEVADIGERRCAAAEIHLDRGGKIALQILPGACAGEIHARHDLLLLLAQKIAAVLFDVGQKIGIVRQHGIGGDDLVQIFLCCHKLAEGRLRADGLGELVHQAAGDGGAFAVLRVGGSAQAGIAQHALKQVRELLLLLQHAADGGGWRTAVEPGGAFLITGAQLVQLFQVVLKGFAVEAGVERVQRPFVIHKVTPFLCRVRRQFSFFYDAGARPRSGSRRWRRCNRRRCRARAD